MKIRRAIVRYQTSSLAYRLNGTRVDDGDRGQRLTHPDIGVSRPLGTVFFYCG